MAPPKVMGIYPPESVSEVAQSLPLDNLTQGASDLLAGDVEYRIHLILQEAKKFMVHGKRATLLPEDVEHAMEALNVEPVLIPPRPLPQAPFVPVNLPSSSNPNSSHTQSHTHSQPNAHGHGSSSTGTTIYHVPDDEIDFATFLKEPLPPGLANSAGVKWKAHWLAVEGVQPAVAENPPVSNRPGPLNPPLPSTGNSALKASAKAHLPQELQLYFTRLTSALVPTAALSIPSDTPGMPDTERHRTAALASLSNDAAVAGILVYLVKWLVESINKCLTSPTIVTSALLDGVLAILDNESIFLEQYLNQLLAPVMSVLLTVPLGPYPTGSSTGGPSPFELRSTASSILNKIAKTFGPKYPNLIPRISSTLAKTLNSSPFPSPLGAQNPPTGRYEGSILGLTALGPSAVRTTLFADPSVLRRISSLCDTLYPGTSESKRYGKQSLARATVKALSTLVGPKPDGWGETPDWDLAAELFGGNLVRVMEKRPWLTSELLRMRREGEGQGHGGMAVD